MGSTGPKTPGTGQIPKVAGPSKKDNTPKGKNTLAIASKASQ